VNVRGGATTEYTDSDTHTQRERNTHRTHAGGGVRVYGSDMPKAR
jgi:hypothetical protein